MNRSFIKNFPSSLARFIESLPCLPSSEGNAEYPLGQASFSRCPYDTFLFRSAAGTNVMEDLWCLTGHRQALWRSAKHTSELQSLMRISYAVLCLKKQIAVNIQTREHVCTTNHKDNHKCPHITEKQKLTK